MTWAKDSAKTSLGPCLAGASRQTRYKSMSEWRTAVRECFPDKTDQNYPPFVIVDEAGSPVGKVPR